MPVSGKVGGWLSAALCASFLVACDGSGSTPTAPPPPPPPPPADSLTLDISVDLEARFNLVLIREAVLLYDGSTVRTSSRCLDGIIFGCRKMRLSASSTTTRGAHAVAVRLVSHTFDLLPSTDKASYDAVGKVNVRDATGVLQEIALPKRTESLAPGDSVNYSIDVLPEQTN